MRRPRAMPRPAIRKVEVAESLPPGFHVKDAGVQLARLFGEELMARLRARQRAARAAKGAIA